MIDAKLVSAVSLWSVQEAAWYVARISADLDTNAVAAFKESLQQSCR